MIFKHFTFLISLFICNKILNVDNIYIIKDKNNYSIVLDIKKLNFSQNIIAKNIFNIILESKNPQEKNKNITIICNFISSVIYTQIICLLEKTNLLGPFYFRQEYFKKSFIIKFKNEY